MDYLPGFVETDSGEMGAGYWGELKIGIVFVECDTIAEPRSVALRHSKGAQALRSSG
jgi:hypothetical protein